VLVPTTIAARARAVDRGGSRADRDQPHRR
jgi:hypothetical protein